MEQRPLQERDRRGASGGSVECSPLIHTSISGLAAFATLNPNVCPDRRSPHRDNGRAGSEWRRGKDGSNAQPLQRVLFMFGPTSCSRDVAADVVTGGQERRSSVACRVTKTYVFMADPRPCPAERWAILTYPARFDVDGKGVLPRPRACWDPLELAGIPPASRAHRPGRITWTGTISVPGVEFDTIAPTIRGATSRVVRARRSARRVRAHLRG